MALGERRCSVERSVDDPAPPLARAAADQEDEDSDEDRIIFGPVLHAPPMLRATVREKLAACAWSTCTDSAGRVGLSLLQTAAFAPLRIVTYGSHAALLLGPAAATYATVQSLYVFCSCLACANAPPRVAENGGGIPSCVLSLLQWVLHVDPAGWRTNQAAACAAAGIPVPAAANCNEMLANEAAAAALLRILLGQMQVQSEMVAEDESAGCWSAPAAAVKPAPAPMPAGSGSRTVDSDSAAASGHAHQTSGRGGGSGSALV